MWIELHDTLLDHRKLKRLSRRVTGQLVTLRGHLVTLWLSVLRHAPDGNLEDWTSEDIADYAEWSADADEFVEALVASGFLDRHDDGHIEVHDWGQHAQHLKAAKRKRNERARKKKARGEAEEPESACHVTSRDSDRKSGGVTQNRTEPNRTEPNRTEPSVTGDVSCDAPADLATTTDLGNYLRARGLKRVSLGADTQLASVVPIRREHVDQALAELDARDKPRDRCPLRYVLPILEDARDNRLGSQREPQRRRPPPDPGPTYRRFDPYAKPAWEEFTEAVGVEGSA